MPAPRERSINHPFIRHLVALSSRWKSTAESHGRRSPRAQRLAELRQHGVALAVPAAFAAIRNDLEPGVPGAGTDEVDAQARAIGDLIAAADFDGARAAIKDLAAAFRSAATAQGVDPRRADALFSALDLATQKQDAEEATTALDAILEACSLPPLTAPSTNPGVAGPADVVSLSARMPRGARGFGRCAFAATSNLPPDVSAYVGPHNDLGAALTKIVEAFNARAIVAGKLIRELKTAVDAYLATAPESADVVATMLHDVELNILDAAKATAAIAVFCEATGVQVNVAARPVGAASTRRLAFGAAVPIAADRDLPTPQERWARSRWRPPGMAHIPYVAPKRNR